MDIGAADCACRHLDDGIPPLFDLRIRYAVAANVVLAMPSERSHRTISSKCPRHKRQDHDWFLSRTVDCNGNEWPLRQLIVKCQFSLPSLVDKRQLEESPCLFTDNWPSLPAPPRASALNLPNVAHARVSIS